MRSNYPETYNYLKAKKARHPRDDAIEDFCAALGPAEAARSPIEPLSRSPSGLAVRNGRLGQTSTSSRWLGSASAEPERQGR